MVNSNLSYIIEPLPGSEGHHLIYRSEHLKLPPGNCGFEHSGASTRDWGLQFTNQIKKGLRRVSSQCRSYPRDRLVPSEDPYFGSRSDSKLNGGGKEEGNSFFFDPKSLLNVGYPCS